MALQFVYWEWLPALGITAYGSCKEGQLRLGMQTIRILYFERKAGLAVYLLELNGFTKT